MLKKIFILIIFIPLLSCGGGWEEFESAVSGQKKRTTDEYLIKKKDPLILPPDYKKLPLPNNNQRNKETNKLEIILGEQGSSKDNVKEKSKIERSIQEELRKSN